MLTEKANQNAKHTDEIILRPAPNDIATWWEKTDPKEKCDLLLEEETEYYPYFWRRYTQWIHKMNTWDTDPLFTKFLQVGSAKVVLPVHPAYNDAVMYFLENNGAIWSGGETQRLKSPMFLSIPDEFRNQTDDLAGAVPEGKPFDMSLTLSFLGL